MVGVISMVFGVFTSCFEMLAPVCGIPLLPGMSGEVVKGAAIGASEYGADWFKTIGKVFENFFDLNII